MLNILSKELCSALIIQECPSFAEGSCKKYGECRIQEKTDEQLNYILSPYDKYTYLEACAGSGKTEVLGMKAAYEMCKWNQNNAGIAVLTFTNEAAMTVTDRIASFYPNNLPSIHYVGTFASFVHGYITQKFGYAFFMKKASKMDCSFTIVDVSIKSYNNWLNYYALDFPVPPKKSKIYANQLFFNASSKDWFIQIGDTNLTLKEYYNLPEMQTFINSLRVKAQKDYLFKFEFLISKAIECKKRFWGDGFANFEDMNIIAISCLKHEEICKRLSKKFPLIMVDECQDLSFIELEILDRLRISGSSIHFIGDLNQAIYSFKDAHPQFLLRQIASNKYTVNHLSNNFRSTQKIVDVACALQGIEQKIIGNAPSPCGGNDALYYEYTDEQKTIQDFMRLTNKYGISSKQSIVLVRNSSLKDKINNTASLDYEKHAIINAIQLWKTGYPEDRKTALQLMGWQIQKWLKSQGRKDRYYCPESLCQSVFLWRLALRDILNDFSIQDRLCSFSENKYSDWYHSAKNPIIDIVDKHIYDLFGGIHLETENISFRVPSGTASQLIQAINGKRLDSLHVETIHSVKGCSYDAVLLISAPDARGKTGYWENWIDDKDETTRFGYVACTRPRYLLCWAVPVLSNEQRTKLESIGFLPFEKNV